MTIRDWPLHERPREKLLNQGAGSLSDAELLAIFLRTGIKGKTAVDLARDLLSQFGNIRNLLATNASAFCKIRGLGITKYTQLQAALEIGRRHLITALKQEDLLLHAENTKNYLTAQMRHKANEVFACLFLDARNHLICFEELFHGTINCVNIHPRIILKRALDHQAVALILAHNHPSGNPAPSVFDKELTQQLTALLKIMDICVLDHIIVGESKTFSFAEHGLL